MSEISHGNQFGLDGESSPWTVLF